ncbi:MAG: hypothetical protein RBS40_03220 [Rhodocyclaceae bacterium]|jgi:hypothetical protein|nr:hypothetical protein [Rhodocyclaceae bacterium]
MPASEMSPPLPPPAPPEAPPRAQWLHLAGLAAIAAATAIGYRLLVPGEPPVPVELPLSACDLNLGACQGVLPHGGRFTLSLGPRPIPVAVPLEVEARFEDIQPDGVELDLDGVDMRMPLTRSALQPARDGRFTGHAELPVCITTTMQWRATLLVELGGTRYAQPFLFETRVDPG